MRRTRVRSREARLNSAFWLPTRASTSGPGGALIRRTSVERRETAIIDLVPPIERIRVITRVAGVLSLLRTGDGRVEFRQGARLNSVGAGVDVRAQAQRVAHGGKLLGLHVSQGVKNVDRIQHRRL